MNKYLKKTCIFIVISIFIEVLFFNFESLRSRFYGGNIDNLSIYYETNFIEDNGTYVLNESETYSTIEIYNINNKVNNIYVDFDMYGENQIANVEYYIADEGNKNDYLANNNKIIWNNNVLASRYTRINTYGDVSKLVIKIFKDEGETLRISSIKINETRPLFISKIRIVILWTIMFISSLIFSKDNLLNITLDKSKIKNKYVLIGLILLQLIIGVSVGTINKELIDNKYNEQYKLLTDSLINGKTYLDIEVDEKLTKLENPYDLYQRLEAGVDNPLDTAFYNNKYYVYFGVAPVILYYLPFKLITNTYLYDYVVNILNFLILSISFILLAYKVCMRYFKKLPVIIFALLNLVIINACGALNLLSEPRIYTIPILMALAYSVLGLTLWIYSKKDNGINNVLVCLGSLAIGIAIASRPQFGLFAFFAILIFFKEIKDIKLNYVSFVIALLPLIIIGGLLMYYNYIRFDNILDFGANYNLTLNDMTKRGFKLDRLLGGLYYFLLQPLSLKGTFPYINEVTFSSNYVGLIIYEYSFGGLLFICPITIASLFIIKAKNWFINKKLYIFSIMCIVFGSIVVIVDINVAGLVERYFSDFSIYFLLSSSLIILSYINNSKLNVDKLYMLVSVVCMACLLYCFFRLFANTYQTLELCNPKLYYKVLSYFII